MPGIGGATIVYARPPQILRGLPEHFVGIAGVDGVRQFRDLDKPGAVGSLGILQLRKYKTLFRDDAAYATFISAVRSVADPAVISVLLDDEQPICGVVSTQDAQDAMRMRILSRLMEDPKTLDEIRRRLEDDKMVEYGSFE